MPEVQVKTKRNQLSYQQMFKLCEWLKGNVQRLHGQRSALIAELATAELKFQVVESNINSACRMAEIKIARPIRSRNLGTNRTDRAYVVAVELVKLLQALGHTVNEDLLAISRRQPAKD